MTCTIETSDPGRWQVAGELCIFHAAELKPQLDAALSGEGDIEIDLSQVGEIDTAGLQLLLYARREAKSAGRVLRFADPSEPVLEALELAGLTPDLSDRVCAAFESTAGDRT